jgi:hypothetical protein
MIHLTTNRIRALCILADGKQHFAEDLAHALNMKLSNFNADVLKALESASFCCYDTTPIETHKRGRPRRPIVLKKDELPFIAQNIHSQIMLNLARSNCAFEEYESAKGNLSPLRDEKLTEDRLNYTDKAEEIMDVLDIPLFRDEVAKIYKKEGISGQELRDLIYLEIGVTSTIKLRKPSTS